MLSITTLIESMVADILLDAIERTARTSRTQHRDTQNSDDGGVHVGCCCDVVDCGFLARKKNIVFRKTGYE